MLADIGEDEIGRDRRRPVESHLALLEAAESLKCCFGGMSVRLGSEQLRDVGVGTAFLAIGEERGPAPRHHISCFEFGMGAASGELHRLVLADRPVKDDAAPGVFGATLQKPTAVADALSKRSASR